MTFILMRLSQRRVVNYGMIYQLNLKKYSHSLQSFKYKLKNYLLQSLTC